MIQVNECYKLEDLCKQGVVLKKGVTVNGYMLGRDREHSYLVQELKESEPVIYKIVMRQSKK